MASIPVVRSASIADCRADCRAGFAPTERTLPALLPALALLPADGLIRKFVLRERGICATTWDRDAIGYRTR